jgi:hypothetical protein
MSSQKQETNDRAGRRVSPNYVHINIFVCNAAKSLAMLTAGIVAKMLELSVA